MGEDITQAKAIFNEPDLARLIRRAMRCAMVTIRPIRIPKAHRDGLQRIMLAMLDAQAQA